MSVKVIRVDAHEFELEDGRIYQHPVELEPDEVPSIAEFQVIFDRWHKIIQDEISNGKAYQHQASS